MTAPRMQLAGAGEAGASAVEYSLVVFAIAALIVAVVFGLGVVTQSNFTETCDTIASAQNDGSC